MYQPLRWTAYVKYLIAAWKKLLKGDLTCKVSSHLAQSKLFYTVICLTCLCSSMAQIIRQQSSWITSQQSSHTPPVPPWLHHHIFPYASQTYSSQHCTLYIVNQFRSTSLTKHFYLLFCVHFTHGTLTPGSRNHKFMIEIVTILGIPILIGIVKNFFLCVN